MIRKIENLSDTVDLMTSEDYKERFVAEYCQLKIRYQKLRAINTDVRFGKMDIVPGPADLTNRQQRLMEELLEVMELRARFLKIRLPETAMFYKQEFPEETLTPKSKQI